jgi:hypothetical protein
MIQTKNILILVALILLCSPLFSQSKFNQENNRIGISSYINLIKKKGIDHIYGASINLVINYEKEILKKTTFSIGSGIKYKYSEEIYRQVIKNYSIDTAQIINVYGYQNQTLGLRVPFRLKYYVIKDYSVFLVLGSSTEFNFRLSKETQYFHTYIQGQNGASNAFADEFRNFSPKYRNITFSIEYGIGFEYSSINIEFLIQNGIFNDDKESSFGVRVTKYLK